MVGFDGPGESRIRVHNVGTNQSKLGRIFGNWVSRGLYVLH